MLHFCTSNTKKLVVLIICFIFIVEGSCEKGWYLLHKIVKENYQSVQVKECPDLKNGKSQRTKVFFAKIEIVAGVV